MEMVEGDLQQRTDDAAVNSSQRKGWRLTLEPQLLAACFTFSLADGVITLLILQQSCLVRLGYSKETCAVLGTQTPEGEKLEEEVQKVAAEVIMWKSLLLNVFPTLAMFFVGPWTDINGRKPVIIAGMTGCTLMYTFYLILSSIPSLGPDYINIAILPLCLLCGYMNFYLAAYCYVSDICHPDDRSHRLGLVETAVQLGGLVGVLCSSHIFQAANGYGLGFIVIFSMCIVICFMALLHAIFFLRESVVLSEKKKISSGGILAQPIDMLKTCFKPRENGGRAVILLCTAALSLRMLSYAGCMQVEFLFLRKQFSWSYNQYSGFSAYSTVVYVIGIYIGTRFLPKSFGVSDIAVAIVGCCLASVRYLLTSLATPDEDYFMYIAIAIGFLGGAYAPALRAILSRVVPLEDLGKAFTLTNSFESLAAIASSPIYTYLYTSSLVTFPGLPFLVSSIIYIVVTILIGVAAFLRKRTQYVPEAN